MAICFYLHGELDIGMDADEVEEEVVQLFLSIVSDHEGVIHISEPAEMFVVCPSECLFFEVLHKEVSNQR
jgi:hypothetical protein